MACHGSGNGSVAEAETHVIDFLRAAGIAVQPIQPETAHVALEAFARYGKGMATPPGSILGTVLSTLRPRPAAPRFSYKGDDFSKTDIESAA